MHTDDRTATYGAAQPEIDEAVRLVLLERGPELVIALDDDLRIVYANPSALEELGYGPEDILGTSVLDFIHPDDIAYAARSIDNRRRHTGETGLTVQLRGRDARGAWRVADVVGRRLEIEGAPPLTVISMRPIDNTPALGSDPSRLRSVIDKTADVILLLAADGTVLFANMTVTRRLGHDRDVLVTRPWLDLVHPDDRAEAAERLTALVEGDDREADWRVRLVDTTGATVVHALRLVDQHDDPLVAGVIVTATEVTALVEMEAKLRRQNELLAYEATHDHVTGLVNRAEFRRLVNETVEHRNDDVVVLFCDLDGFKRVNDRYGHDAGDLVLRTIAARLEEAVRRGDVAARWGGDEFTVLCSGPIDADEADQLRARLRDVIGAPIDVEGSSMRIGVSVGLARLPARTADADALVDQADRAMYADKRARA